MLQHYLTIFWRHFTKNRLSSFINIFGLSAGISAVSLLLLYIWHEHSFDSFHVHSKDIYLLYSMANEQNGIKIESRTPDPLATALQTDYPDLKNIVRFQSTELPLKINNTLSTERITVTDTGIFDMFTFLLQKGNKQTLFDDPKSIVISQKVARKFFGDKNPLGATITIRDKFEYTVRGVLQSTPDNSTLQFDLIIFMDGLRLMDPEADKRWWSSGSLTFVQCDDRFPPNLLQKQLPKIISKYYPDFMKGRFELRMEPLLSIHLNPQLHFYAMHDTVSPRRLTMLTIIALMILFIACFNFTNLSIARFNERLKEMGIRKAIGAGRFKLFVQLLSETFGLVTLSIIAGLGIATILLPQFNIFTGRSFEPHVFFAWPSLVTLFTILIFTTLMAGIYPSFYFAFASSATAFRKAFRPTENKTLGLKKILIIAQFTAAIILVTALVLMHKQIRFMRNYDLGFHPEHIMVLPISSWDISDHYRKIEMLREYINQNKMRLGIRSTTVTENIPGSGYQNRFAVIPPHGSADNSLEMTVTSADDQFLTTYGIKLLEGRNFDGVSENDRYNTVLINRTAAALLGYSDPVGESINFKHGEGPYTIIGVIDDFHEQSLQYAIEPQIYRYAEDWKAQYLSFRVDVSHQQEAINALKQEWKQVIPEMPFDYYFVIDKYNESYTSEVQTSRIIGSFAGLAILLSCLGLLGVVTLSVGQRTKEIGIRKILGASMRQIIGLLTSEYGRLILVAFMLSVPIAWYLMQRWLEQFAYKTALSWWVFAMAGLLALGIALLTVSWQSWKAARRNPVEALRYE